MSGTCCYPCTECVVLYGTIRGCASGVWSSARLGVCVRRSRCRLLSLRTLACCRCVTLWALAFDWESERTVLLAVTFSVCVVSCRGFGLRCGYYWSVYCVGVLVSHSSFSFVRQGSLVIQNPRLAESPRAGQVRIVERRGRVTGELAGLEPAPILDGLIIPEENIYQLSYSSLALQVRPPSGGLPATLVRAPALTWWMRWESNPGISSFPHGAFDKATPVAPFVSSVSV